MSGVCRSGVLAGLLGVFLSGACRAESSPAAVSSSRDHPPMTAPLAVNEVMGTWGVEIDGVRGRCVLALSGLGDAEDRPALAENCSGGLFDQARRWRLTGETFEVLDAEGKIISRFLQTGPDAYRSVGAPGAEGRYRLERAAQI